MGKFFLPDKHLIIGNRLNSDIAIGNSYIGLDGTITGSITYAASTFTDGIDINANGKYVDFPIAMGQKGSFEIIFKPHFSSASTTTAYIIDESGTNTNIFLRYGSSTEIEFGIGGTFASTSGLSFSANDEIHIGVCWNSAGIDGSNDKLRIYINGVLNGTSTAALSTIDQTDIRIGNSQGNTDNADAVLSNLKVWNYAKIDFSDRIVERISNTGIMSLSDKRMDLFNKLGSASEVTKSVVGLPGVSTGGSFAAGKHDNGFESNAISEYVDFPLSLGQKGSFDIWFKPAFSDSDVTVRSLIDRDDTAISVLLRWDGSGAFEASIGGLAITHSPTFSASDDIHLAVDWDSSGIDDSSDTLRLFYNGVQQASSTTALSTIASTVLRIGTDQSNTNFANGVLDTIKVRNYPKGNYSDKDYEYFSKIGNQFLNPDERLAVWNDLSSSASIQKSRIGSIGTEEGTGESFVAGNFTGNALYIPNWTNSYKPEWIFTGGNAGCIDYWFKSDFSNVSGTTENPYMYYHNFSAAGSNLVLYNEPAVNKGWLFYYFNSGETASTFIRYDFSFSSGVWRHFVWMWDSNGLFGTTDKRRFYLDGTRQTRTSGDLETDAISSTVFVNKPLVIGNFRTGHSAKRGMKGTMQNFRYRNYANILTPKIITQFPATLQDNAELVERS